MKIRKNEIGNRYGRLTVTAYAKEESEKCGRNKWWCRCDCGNLKAIDGAHLRSGKTISCRCYTNALAGNRTRTHGLTGTKLHIVWKHMRARCLQEGSTGYAGWGGRGIKIFPRWSKFENFVRDMGASYEAHVKLHGAKNTFIERIDNDGNYDPLNCKWATRVEQNRNKRNNRFLTHDGRTMLIRDWAKEIGIGYTAMLNRLKRGWSLADALTTPKTPQGGG